ncbi:hypothetical protein F4825DRAFT_432070 [Nemania diffusa]|nr:hypothetical protein F4825DRAFT_432070 [Nemania diffusa]
MMASTERVLNVLALFALIVGNLNFQARYSVSAAFDRPIHFSIATLVLTGIVFLGVAKTLSLQHPEHRQRQHQESPALLNNLRNWLRSRPRLSTFACLVVPIAARVLLNWKTTRAIQCSWDGLYAFLPFVAAVFDHLYLRPTRLPRHAVDDSNSNAYSRHSITRFTAFALPWGFAVAYLSLLAESRPGVICPAGGYLERLIPVGQLSTVFLDAAIISQVARLRQANHDQAGDVWHFLGALLETSAAVLSLFAVWSCLEQPNFLTDFSLTPLEIRDVALDSALAAFTLVSGVYLLGSFHVNVVSLVATATTVSVLILSKMFDGTLNVVWSSFAGFATGLIVFVGFGALLYLCRTNLSFGVSLHREHALALGRCCAYALAVFILVLFFPAFSPRARSYLNLSPEQTMAAGRAESDSWLANAMQSTSLQSAVDVYRQRYGLPPPPNFDKWYDFAGSVNSSIIDTFDQINSDLLPFWAIPPALLRTKTTHLLEHPSLSMGGLLIRDGQISISPHVHGTHRWMVDVVEEMIKPFSQWLPDMQLAFNLDDECRVSVPRADMADLMDKAQAARSRLQLKQDLVLFSQAQDPPWDDGFLAADESIWDRWPDSFRVWSKTPIFSELIATTCPADAPANQVRWWNRKARCEGCRSPHMENGFVRNWTLSADLCHQPDLEHLHGFLTSPSAMAASQSLFPVFSQSRVHNFADILYPSPWSFHDKASYEEDKDIPWGRKLNSVYWRGASSDGFAIGGSWQMFLRARFVHLASTIRSTVQRHSMFHLVARYRPGPSTDTANPAVATYTRSSSRTGLALDEPVAVNVSFVGSFSRCDAQDCDAEHRTFYGPSSAEPPAPLDFQESWWHRHLIDLDGAAFSGRFLPFLRSASLPYRAALFRTWWEERVHPWKHYVPLDLRLVDFWPAVSYFGGAGAGDAQEIAEAGRRWAEKALRKEDMQVYMFRLLLEWGRIIDDERENMGFSGAI